MAIRRISLGPGEVAGYLSRLKLGFDEIGVPCEHFLFTGHKYSYSESKFFLKPIYEKIKILLNSKYYLIRRSVWILEKIVRSIVFVYAVMRCDVFIFLGSGSFFNFHELPLLKLLGKKILVIYLGSDARPPYFSGRYLDDLGNFKNAQSSFFESKKMLTKIIKIEKYADTTINHTATAQFFSKKFVRLNALGTPIDIQAISIISSEKSKNRNKATNNQAIRILHAPSRPIAKGSIIFRTIVNELRAEGYSIEYIELSGVSNQIVLEELHECDFVLDELYSDVPMAVLATEAAIFGKPVIVGGFYAKQYPLDNCDEEIPPSLYIDPAEIKHAIRKMLDDVTYRDSLGTRANYFVTKYWNSKKIAQNYLEVINNEAPKNWLCDPMKLDYCFGWGLSKENWLKQVGEYLGEMGSDALLLDHNPKLKQRVIEEISKAKGMHIS